MTLVATVVDPLTDPIPESWDAFVAAQRLLPMWSSSLLTSADWCGQSAASMVIVADDGGDPAVLFHARHVGLAARHRYVRPGRLPPLTMTECRIVPGMMDSGMAFATGLSTGDRLEAVRVFERAMRRRAGAGALAMAYRDLHADQLALVPTERRVRLAVSPKMVLYNEWSDIDGYLASLPRKWRIQLTKLHSGVTRDAELRVELSDHIDAGEACWLAELVRRRHSAPLLRRPPLPAAYFDGVAALGCARFLTYRDRAGVVVAFTAVVDTGEQLLLVNWGSRDERRQLYFDQYLRLIELMISLGRRFLVLGKGMSEIKVRYGARAEPLWAVVGLR